LQAYFAQFGKVVSVSIVKQKSKAGEKSVESRGFGFVKFASAASAKKAADKQGHRVESRSVSVKVPPHRRGMMNFLDTPR
jgi:RNA recognition motif-containing protein